MSEIISCPSCQRKLQVPETLAGQDVQCPTCGATFVAKVGAAPASRGAPSPGDRWGGGRPDYDKPYGSRPYDEARDPRHGYDDDPYEYRERHRRDLAPHRGAMILTFGLLGILGLFIFSPIAWIMGNADMAEIRAGRMDPEGEGLTQAGRICGIIGTGFLALTVCSCGLMFFGALAGAR